MTDKHTPSKRRQALKTLAAGSSVVVAGKALPESWTRPVINAVMLPAHAATTDDTGSGAPGLTTTPAPTTTPCVIAGEYCWIRVRNIPDTTVITVDTAGNITIVRTVVTNNRGTRIWIGTGVASNGALGGTFNISTPRTQPNNPNNIRNYSGTIVCGSTTIEANFTNPNPNSNTDIDFQATQGTCANLNP